MKDLEQKSSYHFWKERFCIGLIMIFLAFTGMIFTDVKTGGAWLYWRWMAPVYALLSLSLSLHLRRFNFRPVVLTIWHEVLHWVGLLLAVYLVSLLVDIGFISRFQAGLQVMIMLALATFLAGVYIESTFIVVGCVLGFLVLGVAFVNQYLYGIMLPLIAVAIILIFWVARRKKKDQE